MHAQHCRWLYSLAAWLTLTAPALGQVYFCGQFGVDNTWNVYEVRGLGRFGGVGRQRFVGGVGVQTGPAMTWSDADAAARENVVFDGGTIQGHLVSFADPLVGPDESDFVAAHLGMIGLLAEEFWIGLTDNSEYGGADTGPADVHVDPNSGWVWSSGEPFANINRWRDGEPDDCCSGEDGVAMGAGGRWLDGADDELGDTPPTLPFLVEYEPRRPEVLDCGPMLPALSPNILRTPGPRSRHDGKMAVREVYDNGDVRNVRDALNSLFLPAGIVHDYESSTVNVSNGADGNYGRNRDYGLIESGVLPAGDLDNVAIRAVGRMRIDEGQGGVYTFGFNSDGGGELWIYDATFSHPVNGEVTPYGALQFANDRPAADTLGVVTLDPGEYDFEFVGQERAGGSSFELYAAKGAFQAFDESVFQLVGEPPVFLRPTTAKVTDAGWALSGVSVRPEESLLIDSLGVAQSLLLNPDEDDMLFTGNATAINFFDPDTNGASAGNYDGDAPFPHDVPGSDENDFVLQATATLVIEYPGEYTFGFATDEGAELTIEGADFTSIHSLEGQITNGGQSLTVQTATGDSLTIGVTHLEAGNYPIEFTTFERNGGAFAEVFAAPASLAEFGEYFHLLDDESHIFVPPVYVPIQLVAQEEEFVLGDTDGDRDVDLDDLNNVRNFFGSPADLPDADHDGDMDLDDLSAVRNNFGRRPEDVSAVPEPGTLAQLLMTVVLASCLALHRGHVTPHA